MKYIPYRDMKEFYTIPELCRLFEMDKAELRQYADKYAIGPVEDPEIAIGIVLEWGGGGSNALPLVVSIFDAYYSENASNLDPVQEGQLLP